MSSGVYAFRISKLKKGFGWNPSIKKGDKVPITPLAALLPLYRHFHTGWDRMFYSFPITP